MDSARADHHVARFVVELLRTGRMLKVVVEDLVDALPAEAYPGERPEDVVLEMLCGTIATAFASVDPGEVRRAAELIDQAGARTLEHLRLACELSRRMGNGPTGTRRRRYG